MSEETRRFSPLQSVLLDDLSEPDALPQGDCPDAEEIGALIEGTLPEADRLRVQAHLVSCSSCYETYADAVQLLAEDDEAAAACAVPFRQPIESETSKPASRPGSASRRFYRLSWAAAAVVVVGLGAWLFASLNRMPSQSSLISRFEGDAPLEGVLWAPDVPRGGETDPYDGDTEESIRLTFQAGAAAFDLEISARRGDLDLTARYAEELAKILETRTYADELQDRLHAFSQDLDAHTLQGEAARAKAISLARAVEDLDLSEWNYAFGRLIEAAHLAATLGQAQFFSDRAYRKALDLWMEKQPRAVKMAAEEIQALRAAWYGRPLDLNEVKGRLGDVQLAFGLQRADPKPVDLP